MRKRKRPEEHMDESWLIPYADILTLLLALFIVLYSMSTVNEDKFQELRETLNAFFSGGVGVLVSDKGLTESQDNPMTDNTMNDYLFEEKNLRESQMRMQEYFEEMGLSHVITTRVLKEGLLVSIQDIALFDSGRAEVKAEASELLLYLGVILAEVDNHVQVRGHTDNLPINTSTFPSNWELSMHRALNVMKKFTEVPNLEPDRFSVVGYGEYSPITSNDTMEGRSKNRRVELLVERIYTNPLLIQENHDTGELLPTVIE